MASAVLCRREMLLCLIFFKLLIKTHAFLTPGLSSFLWSWAAGQVSSILSFLISGLAVNRTFFTGDPELGQLPAPDKMLREAVNFPWKIEVTGVGSTSNFTRELARSLLISFPCLFSAGEQKNCE